LLPAANWAMYEFVAQLAPAVVIASPANADVARKRERKKVVIFRKPPFWTADEKCCTTNTCSSVDSLVTATTTGPLDGRLSGVNDAHELLDRRQRFGDLALALLDLFAAADRVFDHSPRHVRRLIAIGMRFADVASERAERGVIRKRRRGAVARELVDVARDEQTDR